MHHKTSLACKFLGTVLVLEQHLRIQYRHASNPFHCMQMWNLTAEHKLSIRHLVCLVLVIFIFMRVFVLYKKVNLWYVIVRISYAFDMIMATLHITMVRLHILQWSNYILQWPRQLQDHKPDWTDVINDVELHLQLLQMK